MKLFYTPYSPYARVARVVAMQSGVPIEFVKVSVRQDAREILVHNPAAKVPSLVLETGVVLSETRLICEHIESQANARFLASVDDHLGRHWEGLATGFLDGIAVWVRESRRPSNEQSPDILSLEKSRCERCLDHFEACWDHDPQSGYAALVLASAIDLIASELMPEWRRHRPRLSVWFDEILSLPAMKITTPHL